MSKEEVKVDPITNVEVTRMWYRNVNGVRAVAVKYADPYGVIGDAQNSEAVPIYVGLGGRQPELLVEVLQELERYRTAAAVKKEMDNLRIEGLSEGLIRLSVRLSKLERRRSWKFWRRTQA